MQSCFVSVYGICGVPSIVNTALLPVPVVLITVLVKLPESSEWNFTSLASTLLPIEVIQNSMLKAVIQLLLPMVVLLFVIFAVADVGGSSFIADKHPSTNLASKGIPEPVRGSGPSR